MQEVRSTLPIGSIIGGRYQIEKLLGKGGFGAVYLVTDQRVQQNIFALKEVIDPNNLERKHFVFEAELLRRLDHPALPRVYRVFEDDRNDRVYMLMDYVEGSNLEVLRQQQPGKRFSVEQVLSIMAPIMGAVTYLHDQHPPILHRDIKPSNIIVPTSGDQAMLVDFGIAKEFDPESTTTAVRHASPGYAAPEQYGVGTNIRTDIYGLGATIYTLLTGVVPADAFYRTTRMGSKGTDPLEPILQFAPGVPQYIADAIYRAMAVDINDRFPTVQDFWQALNAQTPGRQAPAPLVVPGPAVPQSYPAVVNAPVPSFGNSTTIAVREQPAGRRSRNGLLLLLLLALLAGLASVALLLFALIGHKGTNPAITPTAGVVHRPAVTATHKPAPSPHPSSSSVTSSPAPNPASGIPTLSRAYNGSVHNTLANLIANMSLTSIKQDGGNIRGNLAIAPPLAGSGAFKGTINTAGALQFTIYSTQVGAPLFFQGNVNPGGSLSGTYCSLDKTGNCNPAVGGYGTWTAFPASPGSGSASVVSPALAVARIETWSW